MPSPRPSAKATTLSFARRTGTMLSLSVSSSTRELSSAGLEHAADEAQSAKGPACRAARRRRGRPRCRRSGACSTRSSRSAGRPRPAWLSSWPSPSTAFRRRFSCRSASASASRTRAISHLALELGVAAAGAVIAGDRLEEALAAGAARRARFAGGRGGVGGHHAQRRRRSRGASSEMVSRAAPNSAPSAGRRHSRRRRRICALRDWSRNGGVRAAPLTACPLYSQYAITRSSARRDRSGLPSRGRCRARRRTADPRRCSPAGRSPRCR